MGEFSFSLRSGEKRLEFSIGSAKSMNLFLRKNNFDEKFVIEM